MSWSARKSEEGRAGSSLATSSSQQGSSGGLFSFLKTELDSFVKGLSGKSECLPPAETAATSTPNPPRKKLKRSHEPKQQEPTYAELKAYEKELDEIRQHTSKRFTNQDYYAPLTAANLQASTSRLQDSNTSPSTSITRDRRSLETRELIDAYSSYYIEEPVPQIPSTYLNRQQSVSESVERRRRKRERAATFVHDEEARQAVARQIAEEEARLRAAEAQAMDHRRAREREAREQKRKQDRAAALARLEAEQLREDAYKQQQRLAEQERQAQLEANARQEGEETRRWEALAHAQRRADRQEAKRQQLQAEAAHQKQADDLAARQRQQTQAQILKEEERVAAQREEEGRQLRQQQRENARRTRDLENAEKERTRALNEASESQRIQELEAEVQRLRRELEEARRKQEEAAALSAQNSRHVHFAPTPPDSLHAEQSFLTQSSSSYSLQGGIKLPPPAPPPPAPPPPPASLAGISKSAKPTPLALLAAHKASTKMAENAKKRPSIVNAAVGMPADMGKFLSEMKNTKLKKVGLPVEGAKKRRDEEETGLKSILENVLKKRFTSEKDRTSASTGTSSTPNLSNNSRLSISTADSLTSFSSYRPPDWSMDLDSSPFPPSRSTSLPKQALTTAETGRPSSSRKDVLTKELAGDRAGLSRTKSQPQLKRPNTRDDIVNNSMTRSHSLAKIQSRSQASFGQAITCEEPAPPTRQKTQAYVSSHHRQSSLSTPVVSLTDRDNYSRNSARSSRAAFPSETRTRQSSDNTMTGRAIRSVGSSFDIDLYTQMQLQDDNDSLEDEMRRSYSNPLPVDGAMDLPSPSGPATQARFVPPQERDVVRATNYIPELTFRQPTFEITSDLGLPAPRPLAGEGRKVSHYTHPRPAHVPPPTSNVDVKASRYTDATGRPLSPSKSRIRQNALRAPLQNLPPRPTEEEDDDILLPYLSEEHAERILREDASVLTGYGTAVR